MQAGLSAEHPHYALGSQAVDSLSTQAALANEDVIDDPMRCSDDDPEGLPDCADIIQTAVGSSNQRLARKLLPKPADPNSSPKQPLLVHQNGHRVFDSSREELVEVTVLRTRHVTADGRAHAKEIRKRGGACADCKRKKRTVSMHARQSSRNQTLTKVVLPLAPKTGDPGVLRHGQQGRNMNDSGSSACQIRYGSRLPQQHSPLKNTRERHDRVYMILEIPPSFFGLDFKDIGHGLLLISLTFTLSFSSTLFLLSYPEWNSFTQLCGSWTQDSTHGRCIDAPEMCMLQFVRPSETSFGPTLHHVETTDEGSCVFPKLQTRRPGCPDWSGLDGQIGMPDFPTNHVVAGWIEALSYDFASRV